MPREVGLVGEFTQSGDKYLWNLGKPNSLGHRQAFPVGGGHDIKGIHPTALLICLLGREWEALMSREDFDIATLASYLHLDPAVVSKMVERGKIPGRKIGGQWKFSHAEIHHWLESRIGVWDDMELARLETALQKADTMPREEDFSLSEMLTLESIAVPLAARTKSSVIASMVELAAGTGWLWDPELMLKSVREREDMYSTALDNGVALLHPRRPNSQILAQPILALGLTGQGIPFSSGRGGLTDLFFLICSVDDRGHLHTLARLSRLLGSPNFLSNLRAAADNREAYQIILDAESKLPTA